MRGKRKEETDGRGGGIKIELAGGVHEGKKGSWSKWNKPVK